MRKGESMYPDARELEARKQREGRAEKASKRNAKVAAKSPQLERLARRLGTTIDKLAERIPLDTLIRLKNPLRETVNPDGTREFSDDVKVIDGIRSQYASDRGFTHPVPQERDEGGKFA